MNVPRYVVWERYIFFFLVDHRPRWLKNHPSFSVRLLWILLNILIEDHRRWCKYVIILWIWIYLLILLVAVWQPLHMIRELIWVGVSVRFVPFVNLKSNPLFWVPTYKLILSHILMIILKQSSVRLPFLSVQDVNVSFLRVGPLNVTFDKIGWLLWLLWHLLYLLLNLNVPHIDPVILAVFRIQLLSIATPIYIVQS